MTRFNLILILLLLPICTQAQATFEQGLSGPPTFEQLIGYEEVMEFEVKYGILKVAWVDVRAIRDTLYNGQKRWVLQSLVRSNSKIPFVPTERDLFTSIIYQDSLGRMVTEYAYKDDFDDGKMKETEYIFDRELNQVRMYDEGDKQDTLDLVDPATAGQLVMLISRMTAGSDSAYRFPVFIAQEMGFIYASNTTEKKKRGSPAFSEDVYAYYSEGQADVDGPFGFSGRYKAWFLDDELRTPLEAHFKVFLGNVRVRLTNVERRKR